LITNVLLPSLGTSRYSGMGPSSTVIMVGFTTYAIVKHRLMDINIVLKKGTTYVLRISSLKESIICSQALSYCFSW
jgi:hypothetical protein